MRFIDGRDILLRKTKKKAFKRRSLSGLKTKAWAREVWKHLFLSTLYIRQRPDCNSISVPLRFDGTQAKATPAQNEFFVVLDRHTFISASNDFSAGNVLGFIYIQGFFLFLPFFLLMNFRSHAYSLVSPFPIVDAPVITNPSNNNK